jgi:hypothetical protein
LSRIAPNLSFNAPFVVTPSLFNLATLIYQKTTVMKTTLYLRIFVVIVTMTAIACSETEVTPTPGRPTGGNPIQSSHFEYHTSVTTWAQGDDGKYIGLVTQTPVNTDLSKVNVFVVKDGKRISIDRELDATSVITSHNLYGEYYWASYQNNVLLLNYIGMTAASTPPFPLEVIIVY